MSKLQVVLDTNILISALRSRRGASYRLLMLVGRGDFEINLSVPLVLEYEAAAKRLLGETPLNEREIDDVLDYLCAVANLRKVFYLWRPFLSDAQDDMILELAVTSGSEYIVTFDKRHFRGVETFGIKVVTSQELLEELEEK